MGKNAAPILIIHGDADGVILLHQSIKFLKALEAAGTPATLYTVPGGGHGDFKDPKVPELTRNFLAKYLKPTATTT